MLRIGMPQRQAVTRAIRVGTQGATRGVERSVEEQPSPCSPPARALTSTMVVLSQVSVPSASGSSVGIT